MNPQKVGRYIIQQPLGQGGMATVYRALDPRFQREVAVKVLPQELVSKATFRARFNREARIIASLEHPAIVPVYDFGEHKGTPYLVMRLMTGGSLADRLYDGPLSLEIAVSIVQQLAGALDNAHSRGIVHRDLKPGNILFDSHNNPHLADFGIVKIAQENTAALTRTGGIIGTPAYMSPEQVMGKDELDGRSDIYALGIIFFEMLTGDLPYKADTPMSIAMQHVSEPVPKIHRFRQGLPANCEAIIATVLAKNRDERFQTAGAFAASINSLVHLPATTSPPDTEVLPDPIESAAELALYDEALQAQQRGDWETAIARLTALIGMNPTFGDAAHQLSHAYRQKQYAQQLAAAQAAYDAAQWNDVAAIAGKLCQDDPGNTTAQELLRGAQRQLRLADAYASAQQAIAAEQWEPALEKLEHILDTAPAYLDAAQLLANVDAAYQLQQQKAQLFQQGKTALQDGLLTAAAEFFEELRGIDPDYPELEACEAQVSARKAQRERAERLFKSAQEHADREAWSEGLTAVQDAMALWPENDHYPAYAAELQKKERLNHLYRAAQTALTAQRWPEAIQQLEQIGTIDPAYKNSADLLEHARTQERVFAQAEDKFAQGMAAAENATWEKAIASFQETLALVPDFKDAAARLAAAESALAAAQEAEQQAGEAARQEKIAALRRQGEQALNGEQLDEAVMIFSELQQMAPDTPGLEAYSSRIQDLRHKLQQAETYFKQAQEYADQEMWDEALVVLEKAAALRPEDPEIAAYRENLQVERTRHQQDEVGVATEVLGAWETAEKTEFEPPPSQPATVVSMENAYETGKHAAGRLPKWSWALLLIPLVIIGLWVIMSSGNRNVTDESLVATAEPFVAAVEPNTATPTPLSTVTAGPTDMPSPSPTSTGTPTSEPSQTPHPTNLPTRAAHPTATQPVIEDGAVLFEEDFAPFLYYQVSYWGGGRDVWQEIFDESQNKVFDGNNIDGPYEYPRFIFGSDTWENYTAQFRIRIVEQTEQWTSASFSFRCNSRFHCYSIHFNAMENMVILAVSDANNPYTELEVETVEIEIGRWHDIEVIALGNDLQVYIDNVSVFEFTDSNRPAGNFHVVVDRGMHVQIDDIQITNRR